MRYEEFDDNFIDSEYDNTDGLEKRAKGNYYKFLDRCICQSYMTSRNSRYHGKLQRRCRCY